jgi:hypothetical protein
MKNSSTENDIDYCDTLSFIERNERRAYCGERLPKVGIMSHLTIKTEEDACPLFLDS